MKVVTIILILIIALASAAIILLYFKTKDKTTNDIALWIQAIATVVLVVVTWLYVNEARLARVSQEKGFGDYVKELQESRKQQIKPYVYAFFYYAGTSFGDKFFLVLKNFGAGPAFDIECSYSVVDDKNNTISHENDCKVLGSGIEKVFNTPFSLIEHVNMKNKVNIKIRYKDSLGNTFADSFEHSLRELADNSVPCDLAEHLRKLEREEPGQVKELRFKTFMKTFDALQDDVSKIKDSVKK